MALTKISTDGFKDDAVTTDKLADAINTERTANTAIDLTALSASNLTSGTVPDARISATSVQQHATSFDDNKIINDISALALKLNALQNATRYNTNSTFVDTFQDANGIASLTSALRDATGEYISTGSVSYGTDQYWATTDLNSSRVIGINNTSFDGAGLIDGGTSNFSSYKNDPNNFDNGVGYQVGAEPDFVAGTKITGFKFYNFQTQSRYKNFKFTVDDNNVETSPETNSSRFGSSQYIMTSNNTQDYISATIDTPVVATATSVIKILFDEHYENVSGNPNAGIAEIQLKAQKLTSSISATGNFISNVVTASASTTKMGVVITYIDNAGTATLNTDLKVSVSADNGSNFTQVTLVAQPDFATGVKMAAANDVTVTAGTQLKYKVEFANQSASKETRVTGVSLQF